MSVDKPDDAPAPDPVPAPDQQGGSVGRTVHPERSATERSEASAQSKDDPGTVATPTSLIRCMANAVSSAQPYCFMKWAASVRM